MKTIFSCDSKIFSNYEESNYDDTRKLIISVGISIVKDENILSTFSAPVIDFADCLRNTLFTAIDNDIIASGYLWDTGESLSIKRYSSTEISIWIPSRSKEMLMDIKFVMEFITFLYDLDLSNRQNLFIPINI